MSQPEIKYVLTTPFTYSHKGGLQEASFVELTSPTSRHSKECGALKQAFFRAQNSLQVSKGARQGVEIPDEKINGEDVVMMLAASKDVDLPEVFDVARKLFTGGVALLDGETKLTVGVIDRMSQDDFEAMLGEYLVNFTLASLLEKMNEKSSLAS